MDQLPVRCPGEAHRILYKTYLPLYPEILPFNNGNVKMPFSKKINTEIKVKCSSKPKLYSEIVKEMASSDSILDDTEILESKSNNVLLFRLYQTLMKSGNTRLSSLHSNFSVMLHNLESNDLRILLNKSPLFLVDSSDIVSIVSSPDIGGYLLKLASNIGQSKSSRGGIYSLINKHQVVMKGNSVYILKIIVKLSTDNMESSLTFKFGSKECLKLKNESLLALPNGCEALVDLRLRCMNSIEVKADILGIKIKDEQLLTEEGKADSKYKKLMMDTVETDSQALNDKKILGVGIQTSKSSSMDNEISSILDNDQLLNQVQLSDDNDEYDEYDEYDEDDEIDIEDVCPMMSTASAPITTIQQEDESKGELIAWIQRYLNGRNQGQGTTLKGIQKQLPRYLKSVYNLQNLKKVLQDNSHIIKQDRGCFRLIYQQEDELRDELIDWVLRYLNGRNYENGISLQEIISHLPRVLKDVYTPRKLEQVLEENSHIIESI